MNEGMIKVSEIREKFPMYSDMTDEALIGAVRRKYYADIPMNEFLRRIDFDTDREKYAPTEGMSGTDKFLAGAGKAFSDIGLGVRQLFGGASQEEVDDTKARDAALMKTGAGTAGNVAGNVAALLPTALVPGVNTVAGASAMGAATGFLQPVASDESRLMNTAIGGGAGAGGVFAGRALKAGGAGAKALVEPFTEKGRANIAGRTLQRFMDNPSKLANVTSKPTITGARPTLAEQTGDAGLARLQDALRALDPQIENQIGQRLRDNNAARVAALESLAGDSTKRAAAESAREAASKPFYDAAVAKTVDVNPELRSLLQRPSVQLALERASNIAKEEGRKFDLASAVAGHSHGAPKGPAPIQLFGDAGQVLSTIKPDAPVKRVSGQTLQDLKMGLDALLKDPTSGIAGKEAINVKATRDALVKWMEAAIPEFNAARTGYAAASKPLNAMDVGAFLAQKATSNTSDLAGNPRLMANSLLGRLRDEKGLLDSALGKGRGNSLLDVFTPDQAGLLSTVASEADRAAAVATAGAGPGSPTAQRLASQNILQQMVGPTGLPKSWADSVVANTLVGKPFNLVYGGIAEPKIQQELAKAVLDPDTARKVLLAAQQQNVQLPPGLTKRLVEQAGRSLAPALAVSGER